MKEFAAFIILISLLFLGGRAIWYRSRVRSILSKHIGDPPTLSQIQARLSAINAFCSTFVFSAERFANIPFRGQIISVAFGPVGSVGIGKAGPMWRTTKTLFAIADAEQTPWMTANSDTFTPIFSGSEASVFWTRIAKL